MPRPLTSELPLDKGGKDGAVARGDRRQQLIEATITSISKFGLSNTTLAKVTQIAGLSPGIVSFYFKSKDALLLATLRYVAEEFERVWEQALEAAGPDAAAQLLALIEVNFDPRLSDPQRIAVWYAFWSEARAREEYLKLCGDRDAAYYEQTLAVCQRIIEEGRYHQLDAEAIAHAVEGMVDSAWQSLLFTPDHIDRAAALRSCRALLASIFPQHFRKPEEAAASPLIAPVEARAPLAPAAGPPWPTLPAWTYDHAELHALERERLFRPNWQIVCHVADLPEAGDYVTLDLLGERALVLRGEDGALRAFHNVCRHRAHAVVEGGQGRCPGVLRCPYHGWSYHLDGRLKAVPAPKGFPGLEMEAFGLVPIELEVFLGFVYIRLQGEGPSVAERMAPVAEELASCRFEELRPLEGLWQHELAVDWKNLWDNYLEGYHFPTGHPGLYDLVGSVYAREAFDGGVVRLSHAIKDKPARSWSARHYQKLLPEVEALPAELRRRWSYYPMFPGVTFDVYPDRTDYLQVLPLGPGRTLLRSRSYALPDERREMRAARYLNLRLIDRVQAEDEALTASVQRGLGTSAYGVGVLSEQEAIVRAFQDWIRERLPVAGLAQPPAPGSLAAHNAALLG